MEIPNILKNKPELLTQVKEISWFRLKVKKLSQSIGKLNILDYVLAVWYSWLSKLKLGGGL